MSDESNMNPTAQNPTTEPLVEVEPSVPIPEPTPEPETSPTTSSKEGEAQSVTDSPEVEPETETVEYAYKEDPIFVDVSDIILPMDDGMMANDDGHFSGSIVFGVAGYTGLWDNPQHILRADILENIFTEIFLRYKLAYIKDPGIICIAIKPFLWLRGREAVRVIQQAIHLEGTAKIGIPGHLDGVDGILGDRTIGAFKSIMLSGNGSRLEDLISSEIHHVLRTISTSDPDMYLNAMNAFSK